LVSESSSWWRSGAETPICDLFFLFAVHIDSKVLLVALREPTRCIVKLWIQTLMPFYHEMCLPFVRKNKKKKRMSDRKREKSFYSPTCFNDGLLFSFSRKNEQELWMRFCNFFFCHLENLFSRWLFSSAFCMCMLTNFHPRSSYRQNRRKIKYHVLEIGRNRIQLARFS